MNTYFRGPRKNQQQNKRPTAARAPKSRRSFDKRRAINRRNVSAARDPVKRFRIGGRSHGLLRLTRRNCATKNALISRTTHLPLLENEKGSPGRKTIAVFTGCTHTSESNPSGRKTLVDAKPWWKIIFEISRFYRTKRTHANTPLVSVCDDGRTSFRFAKMFPRVIWPSLE